MSAPATDDEVPRAASPAESTADRPPVALADPWRTPETLARQRRISEPAEQVAWEADLGPAIMSWRARPTYTVVTAVFGAGWFCQLFNLINFSMRLGRYIPRWLVVLVVLVVPVALGALVWGEWQRRRGRMLHLFHRGLVIVHGTEVEHVLHWPETEVTAEPRRRLRPSSLTLRQGGTTIDVARYLPRAEWSLIRDAALEDHRRRAEEELARGETLNLGYARVSRTAFFRRGRFEWDRLTDLQIRLDGRYDLWWERDGVYRTGLLHGSPDAELVEQLVPALAGKEWRRPQRGRDVRQPAAEDWKAWAPESAGEPPADDIGPGERITPPGP